MGIRNWGVFYHLFVLYYTKVHSTSIDFISLSKSFKGLYFSAFI